MTGAIALQCGAKLGRIAPFPGGLKKLRWLPLRKFGMRVGYKGQNLGHGSGLMVAAPWRDHRIALG